MSLIISRFLLKYGILETPARGLIRDTTVGALDHEMRVIQFFIVLPQGCSFVTLPLGQWVTKVGYFNFSMCYPKGAHS